MSRVKRPGSFRLSLCAVLLGCSCTSGSPTIPSLTATPPLTATAGTGSTPHAGSAAAQTGSAGASANDLGASLAPRSMDAAAALSGAGGTGSAGNSGTSGATAGAGGAAGTRAWNPDAGTADGGIRDAGSGTRAAATSDAAADGGADSGADGGMCQNLICLSIFDCLIYHAAAYGPCKITRCDTFVCKP